MKLLVDNREPKEMISILKSRLKTVELDNLDIGDFVIKTDTGETVMIMERKSLADLVASVKDGRYAEQSFRLTECPINNHNIYYIIEGNIMNFCNRNAEPIQKMIFSSMLSLSYKKGFSLLHTSSPVETCEFIIRFISKLETEKLDTTGAAETNISYSNIIKSSKKANITRENIGEIMLAQIPGLSIVVAQELMKEYKTVVGLVNALKLDPSCLDKFSIMYKNGSRKVNKNVVKTIKDFLL
jgi:ERCC4-type nuclease